MIQPISVYFLMMKLYGYIKEQLDKIDFINELKKLRVTLLKEQQERTQGLPKKINPL